MSWRINRDESKYTDRQLLAWHWALPWMHIPILDSDREQAKYFENLISDAFTDEEVAAAVGRLNLRRG